MRQLSIQLVYVNRVLIRVLVYRLSRINILFSGHPMRRDGVAPFDMPGESMI